MNRVKDILRVAMFLTMIVVLQAALVALPNIQLTTMLFLLFFSFYKRQMSILLIAGYTIIMGLTWGFTIWLIPVFIAWTIVLISYEIMPTINELNLAARSILMAVLFGLTYGLFSWIVLGWTFAGFISYMLADIIFQVFMAISNFLSVLVIYPRLRDLMMFMGEEPRHIKIQK